MADNVFRVTLVYSLFGQQLNNVIHFDGPDSDPARLSQLADEVHISWINEFHFFQTANVIYTGIKVQLLESQNAPFTKTLNVPGLGTPNTGDITVTCHILRLRSAIVGKRGRGRVYIGGIGANTTSNGLLTATTISNWNIRIANMMAAFGPTGSSIFDLGIGPKINTTANFEQVVSVQVAPTLGVQRRRNIGVGV